MYHNIGLTSDGTIINPFNAEATFIQSSGHSNLITCLTSFFWKKNPVRLQKKRKKKSPLVSYGRKWF